jgi:hypothetical protein
LYPHRDASKHCAKRAFPFWYIVQVTIFHK